MLSWPETVAKHGSDEVISCLNIYLSNLPPEVTSPSLYLDGCGGQNKNVFVVRHFFSQVSLRKFKCITYTFPVRCLSYLPNGRDFGRTEISKRKNERVYTFTQWADIIKQACKRKPYDVVMADQSLFLVYNAHLSRFFKKQSEA